MDDEKNLQNLAQRDVRRVIGQLDDFVAASAPVADLFIAGLCGLAIAVAFSDFSGFAACPAAAGTSVVVR